MDTFLHYAPVIFIVFVFLIQYRVFVTPEQMEKAKLEILKEVESKFVTLAAFNEFKEKITGVQTTVNEIYRILIGGKDGR
jgi:hypothetical protein